MSNTIFDLQLQRPKQKLINNLDSSFQNAPSNLSSGEPRAHKMFEHSTIPQTLTDSILLCFFISQLAKPGIFMRAMLLGAQGVFFNFFFVFYLLSPSVAHRFVGALEEEAVITYTNVIREVENGRLPEWENVPAPEMAIDYWKLEKDAKLLDVIKAVRADEATHRFM